MVRSSSKTNFSTPELSPGAKLAKAVYVVALTTAIAASGVLTMIGPQLLAVVPIALVAGIILAVKRSSWFWVCLGYPLIFGLISAWIGFHETPGYEGTAAFSISLVLGLIGFGLIATGLWKTLVRPAPTGDA